MLRPPKRVPEVSDPLGACGCEVRADARQNEFENFAEFIVHPLSSDTGTARGLLQTERRGR